MLILFINHIDIPLPKKNKKKWRSVDKLTLFEKCFTSSIIILHFAFKQKLLSSFFYFFYIFPLVKKTTKRICIYVYNNKMSCMEYFLGMRSWLSVTFIAISRFLQVSIAHCLATPVLNEGLTRQTCIEKSWILGWCVFVLVSVSSW